MDPLFQTKTGAVVRGALDGLAARHRVYANNIANLETPGFQPSDLPFEEQLRAIRDELSGGGPQALSSAPPLSLEPQVEKSATLRPDGNGVDIDREVVRLAENSMGYEAVAQAARMRGEILRTALTEGKK